MSKKIGFIGTGVMGAPMVQHLLQAGYQVNVTNRTKSKTDVLVEQGAVWKESPADVAKDSDIILTIVGYPSDVEQVYFGELGILANAKKGTIVVDMTTSTPTLAKEIYEKAKELGIDAMDAPVSGGDAGAQAGTLTVMVGGEEEVFEKMTPVFDAFSKECVLHGEAGSGQYTKMANQIMVAGTMTGFTEMIVYAKAAGLDLKKVIQTVNGGAAKNWSLEKYGPRILDNDYAPGFYVKHFVKDLKIALDEAKKLNLDLPSTKKAYDLYKELETLGYDEEGTQALVKLWWDRTQG